MNDNFNLVSGLGHAGRVLDRQRVERCDEVGDQGFRRVLRKHSALEGQNPDIEVFIKKPSDRHFGSYEWIACWESGPHDWGIPASFAVIAATGQLAETYYGFDLTFSPLEDRK